METDFKGKFLNSLESEISANSSFEAGCGRFSRPHPCRDCPSGEIDPKVCRTGKKLGSTNSKLLFCEMSLKTSSAFTAGARSETSNAAPGAS